MATVDELIITPVLRLVLQDDITPTASEKSDALFYLNQLVDEWNSEELTVFEEFQEAPLTLTLAIQYTIGPGGALSTTRPEHLVSATYKATGGLVDYPVDTTLTKSQWDRISVKTLGGIPQVLWYDQAYPLGILNIWPQGGGTLLLTTLKQITEFASLATTLAMPAGYRSALFWNLAERLLPAFNQAPRPDISEAASKTLGKIRRKNIKNGQVLNEAAYLTGNTARYDIERGY